MEAAGSPGRTLARFALDRRPAPCHPPALLSARRRAPPPSFPCRARGCQPAAPGLRASGATAFPGSPCHPAGLPCPPPLLSFAVFHHSLALLSVSFLSLSSQLTSTVLNVAVLFTAFPSLFISVLFTAFPFLFVSSTLCLSPCYSFTLRICPVDCLV